MTRLLISLLAATALAGCAVGPDYRKPDLALTPAFHTPAPTAEPDARPARLDAWWTAFGDPELTRVVERAAAQNLDLEQARARLTQSRAAAKSAGAALLPVVDATGSAAKVDQSLDGPIGTIGRHLPGFERDIDDYTLGLGASWEIDLFGGLRRGREAARADADAYLQARGYQARLAVAHAQETVDADRDLLSASDQLVQANAGAARAAVASFRALGGGWSR